MTPDELQDAIALGREQRGVEFKGPGQRDDNDFMAKVTRAILGMANKEDGGEVVIGVEDQQSVLTLVGLSPAALATWKFDEVQSFLSNYVDPFVDIEVAPVTVGSLTAVVVTVRPFVESPVLCKKDYIPSKSSDETDQTGATPSKNSKKTPTLQAGALYIRGRGKIETVRASTHTQMREVLDRAAEATARRLIAISRRIQPGPTDADRFAEEAKDLP
jgi:predicted HTH transcriptional regulator